MKKALVFLLLLCLVSACVTPAGADALSVGDVVLFGRYELDNDPDNGPEDIEWIVLARQNGNVMLLSRYILDILPYHAEKASVTWETCSLRAWLNGEFRDAAFTASEQALLRTVTVKAPDRQKLYYQVKPGNDTQDQVYLLSQAECEKYFFESQALWAAPLSGYTGGMKIPKDKATNSGDWWLRTPGKTNKQAVYILRGGELQRYGMGVENTAGVRPVIVLSEADITPAQVKPSEYTALLTGASSEAAAKKQFEADRFEVRELCKQNYYHELDTLSGNPVITGKLVFSIRTENASEIDSFTELWYGGAFYNVPDELLAKTLAEADTAVFIYAENTQIGTYTGSGRSVPGYRTTTYVAVMDLRRQAVYKAWKAAEDDPPETATVWETTLAVTGQMDIEGAIAQVLERYTP